MTTNENLTACDGHARQVRPAGRTDLWLCEGCAALLDNDGQLVATGAEVLAAAGS